jgi:hypothetical protein
MSLQGLMEIKDRGFIGIAPGLTRDPPPSPISPHEGETIELMWGWHGYQESKSPSRPLYIA